MTIQEVEVALANMAADWRRSAAFLRREVERGVAIGQSAESKLSRAEVLESNADQLDRLRKTVDEVGKDAP